MTRFLVLLLFASSPALADGIATWQGYGAEARTGARASLTFDGPVLPVALPAKAWKTIEVHGERESRVKFLERADGVKLLLWVDRDLLVPFTVSGAKLSPTSEGLTKPLDSYTPGMLVRAGTRVYDLGPDENGHTNVRLSWRWDGGSFEVTGYVMTNKINRVFRHVMDDLQSFEPDLTVPGNFALLDQPNGKRFAVSKNTQRVEVMTLKRKPGFVLVRTAQGAVGWLATKHTKRIPPAEDDNATMMMSALGGGGSGIAGGSPPTLPAKTALYDSIDGVFVGETEAWFSDKPVEELGGWLRFDIKTRFGVATVWARKP